MFDTDKIFLKYTSKNANLFFKTFSALRWNEWFSSEAISRRMRRPAQWSLSSLVSHAPRGDRVLEGIAVEGCLIIIIEREMNRCTCCSTISDSWFSNLTPTVTKHNVWRFFYCAESFCADLNEERITERVNNVLPTDFSISYVW